MVEDPFDAVLIGAGPIGSYTALSLSNMGYSICLLEDHPIVGRPVQCAGLINSMAEDLPLMRDILKGSVLNRVSGADLHSPSGVRVPLRAKTVKALSIDRGAFDRNLVLSAVRSSSDVRVGCRAKRIRGRPGGWSVSTNGLEGQREIRGRHIIICDGSDTTLRRDLGLTLPQESVPGIGCEVQYESHSFDERNVAVFTGRALAPGFFAWAIPAGLGGKVKIGLCSSAGGDLRPVLKGLMTGTTLSSWIDPNGGPVKPGEISLTFGTVPIGQVEPYQREGIVLIGDAAGMAKPTSGGGIYPGLLAVKTLASSLERSGEGLSDTGFRRFSRSWKRGYGSELRRSMMLRSMIRDVTDEEIDLAFSALHDSEVLEYINSEGNIDLPFTLAAGVFKKDPSLARLIPRFIPLILKAFRS